MRILLLEHPREISEAHFNDIANTPLWSCLMTGYAGGALVRAGFEVDIVDATRLPFEEALGRLAKSPPPDLLAVHAVYSWEGTDALFRMLSELKERGFQAPICLYGFFPGMVWKEILDYCGAVDYVVAGEPEQTLVELTHHIGKADAVKIKGIAFRINGEATFTGVRSPIESPDELPFPLRPSVAAEETVSILASRGCYNNCSFCLIPALDFGKSTWRGRSPENIASEISRLVLLGKRDFYFVDPNFVGPGKAGKERAFELAHRLAELGISFGMETRANDVTPELMKELVKAGLNRLLLGIESCRPEVLKRIGKHTSAASNEQAVAAVREAGIEPEIGFIMFDGQSSIEDVRMNLEFLERNRLLDRLGRTANLLCHEFIALEGTVGYHEALEKNLLAPQGLFGFEGRLLYRDPRTGWLASVAKKVCHFVLREMGKTFSPIHWAGDSAGNEPYRGVNDLLVEIFKRLLSLAEGFSSPPQANRTEELLSGMQEELASAFNRGCPCPVPRGSLPNLKGSFPFRLATTSYIIPDAILPNVKFLGKYLDEIELVLFESGREDNLPTSAEVREMARVASDLDVTYNVHLPSDLFLADPDRALRQRFCESALKFYDRTLELDPTCYVLHLDSRKADKKVEPDVSAWSDRVFESLRVLQAAGMDLRKVAVENLEFPLQRIQPFVEAFNLSLCLDIGHLLRYGHDVAEQTTLFFGSITMAHLHGVDKGKDHKGLGHVPDAQWKTICKFLEEYRGGLSLEVFSLEDLTQSCDRMLEIARKEKRG
ncbi:MAG: cobamide remodeling phosphodiesterase CbiR [Syntrophobacteraceae bacterium]|nr:cobamide remodeling phosphodiesterase CbiR [Syntrophobacteraceae bacterium]